MERQLHQKTIFRRDTKPLSDAVGVHDEIFERELRALGVPRGARSKEDERETGEILLPRHVSRSSRRKSGKFCGKYLKLGSAVESSLLHDECRCFIEIYFIRAEFRCVALDIEGDGNDAGGPRRPAENKKLG